MAAAIADGVPVSRVADSSGIMAEQGRSRPECCFPASGPMDVAIITVNPGGTESVDSKRADSVAE
ncbi:hypothetical protein GCM10027280_56180 [Micromonospora polyrhachis]